VNISTVPGFTVIDKALVSDPAMLVAFTVKLNVPKVVGVPDIIPEGDSVSPSGKLPDSTVHVIVSPVAVSVWSYDVPTAPSAKECVVMDGTDGAMITVMAKSFV
jgi:hypothetical protein